MTKKSKKPKKEWEKRRAWERRVKKLLEPILRIGGMWSNSAFNNAQNTALVPEARERYKAEQEAWDRAKLKLPRWMR